MSINFALVAAMSWLLLSCSAKKGDDDDDPTDVEGVVTAAQNAKTTHTPYHTRFDFSSGTFEELPAPALERTGAISFAIGGGLLLLGGFDNSLSHAPGVERYDAATKTWTIESPQPDPGFAFNVKLGNKICGVGGLEDWTKPIRRRVDCYDTVARTWTQGKDVPLENAFFHVIAYDEYAYVIGGLKQDTREPLSSVWRYDASRDTWEQMASLPVAFFAGGLAAVAGKIYVAGGYRGAVSGDSGDDVPKDTDTMVYDIAADDWATLAEMPHARLLYGTGHTKGKIATFMGFSTDATPTMDVLDPESDAWAAAPEPEIPRGASAYAVVQGSEKLLFMSTGAIDAEDSREHRGKLMEYDGDANAWTVLGRRSTDLPEALFIGVEADDGLHFIGAHTTVEY